MGFEVETNHKSMPFCLESFSAAHGEKKIGQADGPDRNAVRTTLGNSLAVSVFPVYVPV
jgi:hypothetical protein